MNLTEIYKWTLFRAFIAIFVLFFVNWVGVLFHVYGILWWLDIATHTMGGAVIGFLTYALLVRLFSFDFKTNQSWIVWLLVLFCVFVGWELYEVIVLQVYAQNPFDLLDTLHDIINDLLGGLISCYWIERFLPDFD